MFVDKGTCIGNSAGTNQNGVTGHCTGHHQAAANRFGTANGGLLGIGHGNPVSIDLDAIVEIVDAICHRSHTGPPCRQGCQANSCHRSGRSEGSGGCGGSRNHSCAAADDIEAAFDHLSIGDLVDSLINSNTPGNYPGGS